MAENERIDYAPVLARLLPPDGAGEAAPVHDVLEFLKTRFGEPVRSRLSESTEQLTFQRDAFGVNAFIDVATSRLVGLGTLAFTYPLWKSCPQSRFSGVWVVGTGVATFVPLLGSALAAGATATALALADYYQQMTNATPGLCQGLCTKPCWCVVDAKAPTLAKNIAFLKTIFGVPVLIEVKVTLSGWVIAHCEGWNF
jgi:hypothetical protein